MTRRVIFLGTSFLGAIKQGMSKLPAQNWDFTYIGFIAPTLLKNLSTGWKISGNELVLDESLECFLSNSETTKLNHNSNKTFPESNKISGLTVDLTTFDFVVFVDMFFRIRTRILFDGGESLAYDGIPVSKTMLNDFRLTGFNGWGELKTNALGGDLPIQDIKRFMAAIKSGAHNSKTYLLSAPRPPAGQFNIFKIYGDLQTAKGSLNFIEDFYEESLNRQGINYVRQPAEVLDQDGCLTDPIFSRGEHPSKPGVLDEHMNAAYGEIVCRHLLHRLDKDFAT